jgi:hypothetical protein
VEASAVVCQQPASAMERSWHWVGLDQLADVLNQATSWKHPYQDTPEPDLPAKNEMSKFSRKRILLLTYLEENGTMIFFVILLFQNKEEFKK